MITAADRALIERFHAERAANPDLAPYVGPGESLERFLAGDVVTYEQFVADGSVWTVKNLLPEQMRRLRWMLDHG